MPHDITLQIKDADWITFKKYFLKTHPNQLINGMYTVNDDAWIAHRILLFAQGAYNKSVREEFEQQNTPPFDTDIIKLL